MRSPPLHQCLIVGRLMTDFPVNLRNIIINPAFTRPKQNISIQIVIILQAIGITSQRVTFLITIDSERTDSELYPRLHPPNGFVQFLNQHIHITTSPVRLVSKASAITGKTCVIGKIDSLNRIRIEIVIHVDSVHIIAGHNIRHDFTDIFTTLGKCRVEVQLVSISNKPFRMLIIYMFRRQLVLQGGFHPIRINPGMKLHIPFPAFLNHELHRVPHRRRHLSLCPCQKTAPRFMLRSIQRIRFGTHLKDNRINTRPLKRVQLANQCLFQSFCGNTAKLSVDSLYPCSTKLTFGIFVARRHLCPHSHSQKKSQK